MILAFCNNRPPWDPWASMLRWLEEIIWGLITMTKQSFSDICTEPVWFTAQQNNRFHLNYTNHISVLVVKLFLKQITISLQILD